MDLNSHVVNQCRIIYILAVQVAVFLLRGCVFNELGTQLPFKQLN